MRNAPVTLKQISKMIEDAGFWSPGERTLRKWGEEGFFGPSRKVTERERKERDVSAITRVYNLTHVKRAIGELR